MGPSATDLSALSGAASSSAVRRAIGGWSAVIQFELEGEETPWHLVVEAAQLELRCGAHIKPTAIVRGSSREVARAVRGEIDITHLIARGSARVGGRYVDVINFGRVASAWRRSAGKTA